MPPDHFEQAPVTPTKPVPLRLFVVPQALALVAGTVGRSLVRVARKDPQWSWLCAEPR